ncbi:MAG TPA: AMP-binding protein, partial [Bacteroidales bacterium]|nr:AMP-binding protein [Bacteroidales bacterium]
MNTNDNNLVALFQNAIRNNWEFRSLSDYGGDSYTYREIGTKILWLHRYLKAAGVRKGDKVALLGKNSAHWGIVYIATVTYGAVIVPILPDFKPADVHSIVTHSDALVLFVEESIYKDLNPESMPLIGIILNITDNNVLFSRTLLTEERIRIPAAETVNTPMEITPELISFDPSGPEDIAVISYTSGTTGFSKGVVLQHKSLLGNILFAQRNMPLNPQDKLLSFLPLAHTYGCAFEFLFPFTLGCDITFLTKTPSPKIIMQAFQEIRPALILSVPLVIEKIFKTQILPLYRKPGLRTMIRIPLLNKIIYAKMRQKLMEAFGSNFRELIIGGAPFNTEAEKFFKKINFPFTIGYGMTECGPLISYASWNTTRLGASGRIVNELEVKIDSPDPIRQAGEILLKGNHVMAGYYKNPEATRAVIDNEGWLHSGDLGVIDTAGNIYIRGRSKSMILGANGKNIYPEEIEAYLNNRFMVMESLVIDREGKLIALIYPDLDAVS